METKLVRIAEMRLKIYLLCMLENMVLSSYSIIDHRKVLKM